EAPRDMALRLALEKARSVARRIHSGIVLGADTIVVLDGKPLGKPVSPRQARQMLRRLSGRRHTVLSGLAIVDSATGTERSGVAQTSVEFHRLAEATIRTYAAGGEPMDKAGAYAIQGEGGRLVKRWWGSPSNVIGLPLEL